MSNFQKANLIGQVAADTLCVVFKVHEYDHITGGILTFDAETEGVLMEVLR